VIVSPGPASKRREVQDHFGRIIEYLVHSRQIDQNRIKTIEGRKKERLSVELWIVPQGATPPNP
jgi:hypothetical protein